MPLFPYRRHALAVALLGALTTAAHATDFPSGIVVESGSAGTLHAGDTVSAGGAAAGRAITVAPRGSLDVSDIAITLRAHGNDDGYAYAVLAFDGSESSIHASQLTLLGNRAVGVQAQGGSRFLLHDAEVALGGDANVGVVARRDTSIALQRSRIRVDGADGTGLFARGEGARIVGDVQIEHAGGPTPRGAAQAVAVRDGGAMVLTDSAIIARPSGADAVFMDGGASVFTAAETRVVAEGERAAALSATSGTFHLTHGELRGGGYAIRTRAGAAGQADVGQVNVGLFSGSLASGRIQTGGASLALVAEDSEVVGDVRRAGEGTLDMTLRRSRWRGRADAPTVLRLERSAWQIGGNSTVGHLAVTGGSAIAFDETLPTFATLRAQRLDIGDGGALMHLRTRLDAGGPLARQGTDRLLVAGDVTGRLALQVVATGAGAATAPGASGGISLAQVGGRAAPDSFRLVGDYVAIGPWRYELRAFAPGEADAAQRMVDGEGDDYWDFRLQSRRIGVERSAGHGPLSGRGVRSMPAHPARHALAPQAPAYLVLAGALFESGLERVESLRPEPLAAAHDPALRAHVSGTHATYRSTLPFSRFGFGYMRSERGLHVGGDVVGLDADTARLRSGVVASIGTTRIRPRAADGVSEARADTRGLALTQTILDDSGWRLDAAYGFAHHRIAVRTPSRGEVLARLYANANDASLAGTFHVVAAKHLTVDPGASLVWQRLRFGAASDADGMALRTRSPERMTARAGARVRLAFEPQRRQVTAWSAYLDGRYVASRDTGAAVELSGVRFATGRGGRGIELGVGSAVELSSGLTCFADVTNRWRLGAAGEAGVGARLGLAMTF